VDQVERIEHGGVIVPIPAGSAKVGWSTFRARRIVPVTLFLYGTLLPGLTPTPIAATAARLYALGRYPGLVPDAASRVTGELFAAPDAELLAKLDAYEGDTFRRVPATATTPAAEAVSCWLYEYAGDVCGAAVIASGDYRRWLACRPAV
jgi:gamma-glutamylcyclotransferase (GGCT)/AIG2-like uncharacterized protein YtfP